MPRNVRMSRTTSNPRRMPMWLRPVCPVHKSRMIPMEYNPKTGRAKGFRCKSPHKY